MNMDNEWVEQQRADDEALLEADVLRYALELRKLNPSHYLVVAIVRAIHDKDMLDKCNVPAFLRKQAD